MTKHFPTTPGLRAAMLAGAQLRHKDGSGDLAEIVKAIEVHTKATNERLGKADTQIAVMREELAVLEQKASRSGDGGGRQLAPTVGERFVEAEHVKSWLADHPSRGKVDLRLKATITSATTDASGSVGAGIQPQRVEIDVLPRRRLTVRALLPVVQTDSNSVEVPLLKARNLNAGMVAEGAAKPGSDLQLELVSFPTRTIAHWVKASKQVIDDLPQLRGLIDTELLYGLALKEEQQLLYGDGSGQNLTGMVPQATAFAPPASVIVPDLNILDVVGIAVLQAALSEYPADGVIMHPADWTAMRLLKDSTGQYIFGSPGTVVEPRLWGLPVVTTQAIAARKFLVGQFQRAATIYDRWDARLETGYENDDFTKNLITVLAEERLAFAVKRPQALVYGDFDAALAL